MWWLLACFHSRVFIFHFFNLHCKTSWILLNVTCEIDLDLREKEIPGLKKMQIPLVSLEKDLHSTFCPIKLAIRSLCQNSLGPTVIGALLLLHNLHWKLIKLCDFVCSMKGKLLTMEGLSKNLFPSEQLDTWNNLTLWDSLSSSQLIVFSDSWI